MQRRSGLASLGPLPNTEKNNLTVNTGLPWLETIMPKTLSKTPAGVGVSGGPKVDLVVSTTTERQWLPRRTTISSPHPAKGVFIMHS